MSQYVWQRFIGFVEKQFARRNLEGEFCPC